jgi:hypothetical protein
MLVYPREVLQNRRHHHDGGVMQDKSAAGGGFTLRVAASFNIPVKAAPFGRWTLRDKALRSAPYLQR